MYLAMNAPFFMTVRNGCFPPFRQDTCEHAGLIDEQC